MKENLFTELIEATKIKAAERGESIYLAYDENRWPFPAVQTGEESGRPVARIYPDGRIKPLAPPGPKPDEREIAFRMEFHRAMQHDFIKNGVPFVISVFPNKPDDNLSFAYTVGMKTIKGHPDLIIASDQYDAHTIGSIVNMVAQQGLRDDTFKESGVYEEILMDKNDNWLPIKLVQVPDSVIQKTMFATAEYYEEPFDALQVLLSDMEGRFPGDEGYNHMGQDLSKV